MKTSAYDLEERTATFGEAVIEFCPGLPGSAVNSPLISQLVRAATSVGANYCEADDAESKKDFRHKIGLCRKESRETKYWLRMIVTAVPAMKSSARPLWTEAKELHLIFVSIIRTTDRNLRSAKATSASSSSH
ncbi:MAG: four helix bundle protein [Opitutaceae bacterium]